MGPEKEEGTFPFGMCEEETHRASTKMGKGGCWSGDRDGCLSFQKKNKFPLEIAQIHQNSVIPPSCLGREPNTRDEEPLYPSKVTNSSCLY